MLAVDVCGGQEASGGTEDMTLVCWIIEDVEYLVLTRGRIKDGEDNLRRIQAFTSDGDRGDSAASRAIGRSVNTTGPS